MKRILIIEDDASISELQKDYLQMAGYGVVCAFDGNTGIELIRNEYFDLIILDLMLPKKDGFDILREISDAKQVPILIVSAKSDEISKIKGLNLGANDYITKPFSMGELVARVNSHIKTYEKFKDNSKVKLTTIGVLSINEQDRRAYIGDNEVFLTQKEFDLLLFFAKNPNRVFSKDELYEKIWGYDSLSDTSTIAVHIARIRGKIETNPESCRFIETVWGVGYRFKIFV